MLAQPASAAAPRPKAPSLKSRRWNRTRMSPPGRNRSGRLPMRGLRLEIPLYSRPWYLKSSSKARGWLFILKLQTRNAGQQACTAGTSTAMGHSGGFIVEIVGAAPAPRSVPSLRSPPHGLQRGAGGTAYPLQFPLIAGSRYILVGRRVAAGIAGPLAYTHSRRGKVRYLVARHNSRVVAPAAAGCVRGRNRRVRPTRHRWRHQPAASRFDSR